MILTNAQARKNFHIVIPGKVADIVCFIVEDFGVTPLEALSWFYDSPTYKNLEVEQTKYWHWGSVSLYDDFLKSTGRKNR